MLRSKSQRIFYFKFPYWFKMDAIEKKLRQIYEEIQLLAQIYKVYNTLSIGIHEEMPNYVRQLYKLPYEEFKRRVLDSKELKNMFGILD